MTSTDDSIRNAIREGVCMHSYDPAWPEHFARERTRLNALFPGHFRAIEHIGSTAIPGLQAKPVIDLLAGVRTMADAESLIDPLCASEYLYLPHLNIGLAERRWLQRPGHVEDETQALPLLRTRTQRLHRALSRRQRLARRQYRVGEIDDDTVGFVERKDVVLDGRRQFDDESRAFGTGPQPDVGDARGARPRWQPGQPQHQPGELQSGRAGSPGQHGA